MFLTCPKVTSSRSSLKALICSISALETAWRDADQPHHREHVLPYVYEDDQDFRVLILNHEPDFGAVRLTVDTPQDLELLRLIYERFGGRDDFSWYEVLDLFKTEPELAEVNANIRHKDYKDIETTS